VTPPERLRFPSGQTAGLARTAEPVDLAPALGAIGLGPPRPVLVLVGGADGLDAAVAEALGALLREVVAPLCAALGVLVIDGGTDAGVMALMGRARAAGGATFPLLGVAAVGTVCLPGEPVAPDAGQAPLEPNHSHFLLVPGRDWGDEVPWISDAAALLAGGAPAVTLVAGGGRITESDVAASLAAGRPTLLLAGSGGIADRLIGHLAAGAPAPLLRPAPLSAGHRVGALLGSLLTGRARPA
jgi:hypothetical protein